MDEQPRTGHTSSVCVQLHETLADVPPDSMSMAQSRDISQQHGPKAAVAAFTTKEICRFLASLGSTPQATAAAQGPQQASGHQPLASITPLWPKLRLASGGREELKPSSRHTACQPPPEAAAAAGDWLYQGRSDEAQLLAPAPSAWGLPQGGHFPATADQAPSLSPQTDPPTTSGKVKRGERRNKMQNSKQG